MPVPRQRSELSHVISQDPSALSTEGTNAQRSTARKLLEEARFIYKDEFRMYKGDKTEVYLSPQIDPIQDVPARTLMGPNPSSMRPDQLPQKINL